VLVSLEVDAGPAVLRTLSAHAQHHTLPQLLQCVTHAAGVWRHRHPSVPDPTNTVAAAVAVMLAQRGLESLVGRPASFPLTDRQVAAVLGCAVRALQPPLLQRVGSTGLIAASTPVTVACSDVCDEQGSGLVLSACSLIVACERHRGQTARACAPLIVDAVRSMLVRLAAWAAAAAATSCAPRSSAVSQRTHLDSCASAISR
jgi:hypothetical protein